MFNISKERENILHLSNEEYEKLNFEYIKDSFFYHYANCKSYRLYCDSLNFTPNNLKTIEDLTKIPLVTTDVFKYMSVYTGESNEQMMKCVSSGTQGGRSTIFRDKETIENMLFSVSLIKEVIYGNRKIERKPRLFVISPTGDDNKELWIANVLKLVENVYTTGYYVKDKNVLEEKLYADICNMNCENEFPVIVTPPILLLHFIDYLKSNHIELDFGKMGGVIITAGGWKKANNQNVHKEEFKNRIITEFHINEPENVRDAFNMVELNTILIDCEEGNYHLPPWIKMYTVNPKDMRAQTNNEEGVLCFCDASSLSYPAFVITDDFGRVSEMEDCKCGCKAPYFSYSRRITKAEGRGCARKIDLSIEK